MWKRFLQSPYWPALFAFALYANTLANGFVNYDDNVLISENRNVRDRSPAAAVRLFVPETGREYLPVRDLSYWLDHLIWGANPLGYHLTQTVLHALVTALLALLLAGMSRKPGVAAHLGALLFAAHPVHVEVVAWISGRKDLLATLFTLGALLTWIAWRRDERRSRYLLSIAAVALAGLSKSTAVVAPVLLLATDLFLHGFRGRSKKLFDLLPHFAVAAVLAGVAVTTSREAGMLQSLHGGNLVSHLLVVARVFVHSVANLLIPLRLHPEYGLATTDVLSRPWSYAALLLTGAFLLHLYLWGRRNPLVLWASVLFLAGYLPTSNLIPFQELGADRYLYLASTGFCFLLALGFQSFQERISARSLSNGKRIAAALAVAAVALLGLLTVRGNAHWKDGRTLWTYVTRVRPGSATANYNLGWTYLEQGRYEQALPHLERALRLEPDHALARVNLGYGLSKLGRADEAIVVLEEAVRRHPRHVSAYYNLACAYAIAGDVVKTLEWLGKAERLGLDLAPLLASDPDLDRVRAHPDFRRFAESRR